MQGRDWDEVQPFVTKNQSTKPYFHYLVFTQQKRLYIYDYFYINKQFQPIIFVIVYPPIDHAIKSEIEAAIK